MAKHLKLLGIGASEPMAKVDSIREFVDKLITIVGMRPLGEPTVHDVPLDIAKLGAEPFEDEGGVTAQIVGYHTLSTSHVAIHTWPIRHNDKGEFHLDIYSCRDFDPQMIQNFVNEFFCCEKMKISDLTSATEW